MFDLTNKHPADDMALLARRRLVQNHEAAAPVVNLSFPGFEDMFQPANAPPAVPLPPPVSGNSPHCHAPLLMMKLDQFCQDYELSGEIEQKLCAIQVTGPQVLCLISDLDFCGDGKLLIGEVASICDAQMWWNHTHAN